MTGKSPGRPAVKFRDFPGRFNGQVKLKGRSRNGLNRRHTLSSLTFFYRITTAKTKKLYLGAHSKGIQQAASSDWAASSMTTKSKWSLLTSLRGPSIDALVLVARTTSTLVRISVIALSSLCRSSSRKYFISCLRCFFSDGFFDFPTFVYEGNENVKQTTQHRNCTSSLPSRAGFRLSKSLTKTGYHSQSPEIIEIGMSFLCGDSRNFW